MIQLLMISDIRLYREGLEQILKDNEHVRIVKGVQKVEEAISTIENYHHDVVLFDMATTGALSELQILIQRAPTTKVVALGVSDNQSDIIRCAEIGISGYVFRNDSVDNLIATLEQVMNGELQCSNRVSAILLNRVAELATAQDLNSESLHLTQREHEVLQLVKDGLSNKEIANQLIIEVSTVKNHIHNLLEKLHVHTRGEAVAKLAKLPRYLLHD